MRNNPLIVPIIIKDNPIGPWATTCVNPIAAQDRKLLVWPSIGKIDAFVVVVDVGVLAAADGSALSVVAVTLLDSSVDVRLVVAGGAAGVDALALGVEVSELKR